MELVRLLLGNERRRLATYVGIVAVVAVAGAVAMASLSGARRTTSAFERHLSATDASDISINVAGYGEEDKQALEALPGVVGFGTYAAVLGGPFDPETDQPLGSTTGLELVASMDGRFFDQDRPVIESGRLPDPDRSDEVLVNRTLSEGAGIDAGDRLMLAVFSPDLSETFEYELLQEVEVTVTGVGVTTEEVAVADIDGLQRMILTPAFLRDHPEAISYSDTSFTYAWTGLRLRPGTDLDAVESAWEETAPSRASEESEFRYLRTATIERSVQHAIRPQVAGLTAFGALAGALAVALTGLAVRRAVRATTDEAAVLRAIGASRASARAGALLAVSLAVVVGTLLAVAGAIALSPIAPLGPVRGIEPHPGMAIDAVVLVPIAVLLVAVGLGVAMLSARGDAVAADPALDSNVGARLPLVPGTGVRMAFSRRGTAARSAMTGAVLAALAVVATLVFGASAQNLTTTPRLFGAGFDAALQVGAGYSQFTSSALDEFLTDRQDPDIQGWASVSYGIVRIDDVVVPVLGVDVRRGSIQPSIVEGRPPNGTSEIAVGEETLDALDAAIGDTVEVEGVPMTIVGQAVLPALGQATGDHPSLGVGGWLSDDALRAAVAEGDAQQPGLGSSAVLLDLRDGVDDEAVAEGLVDDLEADTEGWGVYSDDAVEPGGLVQVLVPPRPAELVGTSESVSLPTVLSALLAAGALAALGFALFASVRGRRRELAMLKALGFQRRQIVGSVAVQATTTIAVGLVVGVPLGIALGSAMWRVFAGELGVLSETAVPALAVLAISGGALVAAIALAVLPSRVAALTPAALTLRAE